MEEWISRPFLNCSQSISTPPLFIHRPLILDCAPSHLETGRASKSGGRIFLRIYFFHILWQVPPFRDCGLLNSMIIFISMAESVIISHLICFAEGVFAILLRLIFVLLKTGRLLLTVFA